MLYVVPEWRILIQPKPALKRRAKQNEKISGFLSGATVLTFYPNIGWS